MQVRCVRAHGFFVPGDTSEVPDGAAVSDLYWEPVKAAAAPSAPPAVKAPEPPKAGA